MNLPIRPALAARIDSSFHQKTINPLAKPSGSIPDSDRDYYRKSTIINSRRCCCFSAAACHLQCGHQQPTNK